MKYNTVCVCSPAFRIWINKRKADCVVLTLIAAAVALCAESARAQCYGFQDGTGKSVILNIQNLPKPEVTSFEGVLSYTYDLANVSGNRVTVTTDGAAHSLTSFAAFTIRASSSSLSKENALELSVQDGLGNDAFVSLHGAPGNVFEKGLPAVLPAAAVWRSTSLAVFQPRVASGERTVTVIGKSCASGGSDFATNNTQADFDADGKADYAVWRPANGTWYVILSRDPSAPVSQQWGLPGDVPASGDFDGDGKTDYAVWRPSDGTWYVIPSSDPSAPVSQQWGLPGDTPVPGDYDGDGKADYAVWRPYDGTWYVILSSDPSAPVSQPWGLPGDTPVPGDYDGDGKTDYAVWRPSTGTWYIILSSTSEMVVQQWGLPGDTPVPGDYDGDGTTDYAVWRPSDGTWYVIPSGNPSTPITTVWGVSGDVPVPADYDFDRKTDYAVWRESNGTWYVIPSTNPSTQITTQWGLPGDIPR